jgi:putative ABC transport system permease protein
MLYRLRAIIRITLKRLSAQPGLTLATLLGLVTAVSLITTVPLYADAVSFRILEERLTEDAEEVRLPAFAYMYRYVGTWHGALQWEAVQELDDYLTNEGSDELGLPLELLVRHFETAGFDLYPAGTADYEAEEGTLGRITFVTTGGIADHIELMEGRFPVATGAGEPMEVLVTEVFAVERGIQVGDGFMAYDFRNRQSDQREVAIEVAGVWRPISADDPFWFYKPHLFEERLVVAEESFHGRLVPQLSDEINLAIWYLVLDGDAVGTDDIGWVTSRARRVEQRVGNLLENASNDLTPVDALSQYNRAVASVTRLLTAYNIPLLGLVLAFIGLAVGLSVNQRRNEIAVLRSRGATAIQIIALAVLEGAILGLVALALGMGGGLLITQIMGKSRSFLDFSADTNLRVAVNPTAIRAGLWALGLSIAAHVLPTLTAARDTIITYKQERARAARPPWWQRVWLDLLLFIPAGYGVYLLRQSTIPGGAAGSDPFQNPFLLLLPSLLVLAFTLFCLRLLAWLMAALSWLLSRTDSVSLLLATRHLSRTPGRYATPLLLLVMTVSLSVFTASLAQTLDFQLYDEWLYRTGGDLTLTGPGMGVSSGGPFGGGTVSAGLFLPMSEYLELPGVVAAARVGRYDGEAQVGNEQVDGTYLGIDRQDLGQVAFWRWDFAPAGLGYLLNELAADPDGVLVSQDFLREHRLGRGDFFRLEVNVGGAVALMNAQVVGSFEYFPTWYAPEDGPLFIGNLDSLFQQAGGDMPYQVWLRTEPTWDEAAFDDALDDRGLFTWSWREPYARIEQQQLRPERQGMFGLLTVGFGAAALLTVIGFFLYALFSFRQRSIELGILRAVGLRAWQMVVLTGAELALLVAMGLGLGVGLGTWVSQLFIPALQAAGTNPIPPYLVEIAWPAIIQVTLLFSFIWLLALLTLGWLLRRMQIFQAIKLGETV